MGLTIKVPKQGHTQQPPGKHRKMLPRQTRLTINLQTDAQPTVHTCIESIDMDQTQDSVKEGQR